MGDAHGAVGGVDALPAGPAGAVDVDAEVLFVDCDIDILRLGQHGDGGRRGVDAPAGLGLRHPLHPVHAGFELEPGIGAAPADGGHSFLDSAESGLRHRHQLEAPALRLDVALVHAEQIAAEKRGFVAARARANLKDGVALIGFVRWQEEELECLLFLRNRHHQRGTLFLRQFPHFGLTLGVIGHCLKLIGFLAGGAQRLDRLHDWRELGVFARELCELAGRWWRHGRERLAKLPMALEHPVQALLEPGGRAHRPGV